MSNCLTQCKTQNVYDFGILQSRVDFEVLTITAIKAGYFALICYMHGLELKCKTPSWKQYDHSSQFQSYCFNCNQMKYFGKLPEEIFLWCALNAFFSTILSPEETTLSNGAGRSCWLLRVMVELIYVFVDICEWDTEDMRSEGFPSLCYYSLIFLSF